MDRRGLWHSIPIEQVASYLQVHRNTVYRLAHRGQLPALRLGRRWRFRADVLTSWMDTELERQTRARAAWYPVSRHGYPALF